MQEKQTNFYPKNNQTISTQTRVQKSLIKDISELGTDRALLELAKVKNGREISYPKSVTLRWEKQNGKKEYRVELSENADFVNAWVYTTKSNSLCANNLKIGQTYYWRVDGGEINVFNTKDEKFRFIKINGAHNVRDVGGINIKQGLVYRGSDIVGEYKITRQGKKIFCKHLNIKTEINLRKDGEQTRDFEFDGKKVNYIRLPYRPYLEIFEKEHIEELKDILKILAKEENYPVYIHCIGGADRTGMIAIYLRALLNESDEEILTDYELTSLSNYALGLAEGVKATSGFRNRNDDYFQGFYKELQTRYGSKSFAQNVRAFLYGLDLPKSTYDNIIKILKK